MTSQEQSSDGRPRKDADRPSPDIRSPADGQVGLASDRQPGLVSPSGVNERDRGSADDPVAAGGSVDFDDDSQERPRGETARTGGTWDAQGGDSGRLDHAPGAGLSGSNGPVERTASRGGRP